MIAPATGKAFAVLFQDLAKWDHLSLSLARFSHVRTPLVPVYELLTVRKKIVPEAAFDSGEVRMVDKVTFDGEVIMDRERTRMTQYLAEPGDLIVSKIRARQGSVGLLKQAQGKASVTIHYRVLVSGPRIIPEYAWLAFRSRFVRNQFLAATGGAMKGEISEGMLLDIELPCPDPKTQQAIVDCWHEAQQSLDAAFTSLTEPVKALNDRLLDLYNHEAAQDVIHSRFFALDFKDVEAWDVKSGRASAFRLACPSFRPMGDFIEESTETVRPFDEPDHDWPVYGVNNKDGVFLNSEHKGRDFNAPYKRIRKDWFFHNPTRCNVGSLGIVPEVPEDAITSPEYQVWRMRPDAPDPMLPGFVAVLIQTPFFIDLVQFNRVGAVKQRMYTENLCQLRVPYIPVSEQEKFSQAREKGLAAMDKARAKLNDTRAEIEAMILGTKPVPKTGKKR